MWNCRRNTFDAKKKRICWQNCQGGNLRFFKGSVLTLLYAIDNKKFQWKIGFLSHFRQKYKMVCFCGGFPKFLWDNCWKLYFECVVMVIYCPNCKRYKIRSYVVCKFEKKMDKVHVYTRRGHGRGWNPPIRLRIHASESYYNKFYICGIKIKCKFTYKSRQANFFRNDWYKHKKLNLWIKPNRVSKSSSTK